MFKTQYKYDSFGRIRNIVYSDGEVVRYGYTTMRTDLRTHPDGGKQGTLGCIGLSGESKELLQFVRMVTPFIPTDSKNTSVLLNVVIADNPGCFKAADKTTPALFR